MQISPDATRHTGVWGNDDALPPAPGVDGEGNPVSGGEGDKHATAGKNLTTLTQVARSLGFKNEGGHSALENFVSANSGNAYYVGRDKQVHTLNWAADLKLNKSKGDVSVNFLRANTDYHLVSAAAWKANAGAKVETPEEPAKPQEPNKEISKNDTTSDAADPNAVASNEPAAAPQDAQPPAAVQTGDATPVPIPVVLTANASLASPDPKWTTLDVTMEPGVTDSIGSLARVFAGTDNEAPVRAERFITKFRANNPWLANADRNAPLAAPGTVLRLNLPRTTLEFPVGSEPAKVKATQTLDVFLRHAFNREQVKQHAPTNPNDPAVEQRFKDYKAAFATANPNAGIKWDDGNKVTITEGTQLNFPRYGKPSEISGGAVQVVKADVKVTQKVDDFLKHAFFRSRHNAGLPVSLDNKDVKQSFEEFKAKFISSNKDAKIDWSKGDAEVPAGTQLNFLRYPSVLVKEQAPMVATDDKKPEGEKATSTASQTSATPSSTITMNLGAPPQLPRSALLGG